MNIRWQCNFVDAHGKQNRVYIKDRDFTGDITFVKGGPSPIKITLSGDTNNIYSPILKTRANIVLVSEAKQQYMDLATGDGRKFFVEWVRETTPGIFHTKWAGWVAADLYREQYVDAKNYLVSIIAHDGLGDLESIPFNPMDFDISKWTDYITLLLAKTGLNLPFNSDINIVSEESGEIPFNHFAEISALGLGDTDCFEVLKKLLVSCGATLRQTDGKWDAFIPNDKANNTGAKVTYLGSRQELTPIPAAKKITLKSNYRYVNWGLEGREAWVRYDSGTALGEVLSGWRFAGRSNLINNLDVTSEGVEVPVGIGQIININNIPNFLSVVAGTQNFVFGLEIDFRFVQKATISVTGPGYNLTTDGWKVRNESDPLVRLELIPSDPKGSTESFKITSQPIPFTGNIDVYISLWGYGPSEIPEGYEAGRAIIKNINITTLDNLSDPKTGIEGEIIVNDNEKQIYSIDETILGSIEKTENYPIRYAGYVYDCNNECLAQKFRLKDTNTGYYSLQELLLTMYAKTYKNGPMRLICDFYDGPVGFNCFSDLILDDNRKYMMLQGTLDCRSREWSGCTFAEITPGISEGINITQSLRNDGSKNNRSTGTNNEYRVYSLGAGVGKRVRDLNAATELHLNTTVVEVDDPTFGSSMKASLQQITDVVSSNCWTKTEVPRLNKIRIDEDGNLLVPGNVIAYADMGASYGSIIDNLPVASNTSKGIAQFSDTFFSVNNGVVTVKPGAVVAAETDPTVPTHVKAITAGYISNWNDAYSKVDTIKWKGFDSADSRYGLEVVKTGNTFAGLSSGYICTKDGSSYFKLRAGYADDAGTLGGHSELEFTRAGAKSSDIVDFNSLTDRSFIGSIAATTNTPYGAAWYTVYNNRHRNGSADGNNYGSQIAMGMTAFTDKMWFRTQNSGVWSSWNNIYHSGNSNKSTVDWTAKDLYTDGFIRVKPSYQIYWGDDSGKNFFFNNGAAFLFRPTTTYRFTIDDTGTKTTGSGVFGTGLTCTVGGNDIIFNRDSYSYLKNNGGVGAKLGFSINDNIRFLVRESGAQTIGTHEATNFITTTANTDYNLITRNSGSAALYVQNTETNIASFQYGTSSVNAGTPALEVGDWGIKAFYTGTTRFQTTSTGTKTTGTHTATTGVYIGDTSTSLTKSSCNSLMISTPTGYAQIGSQNSGWFHFITDRPSYYFDKGIHSVGGFTVYGTNTKLENNLITLSCGRYGVSGNRHFFWNGGADVYLAYGDRGTGGRALVHDLNNILVINYGGDFSGGVRIGSNTTVTGTLTATGNVTAYSDMRLKTKIKPFTNILSRIDGLESFYYTRKDLPGNDLHIGTSAQSIQSLWPEFVNIGDDARHTLSLDYGKLGACLAIQGLKETKQWMDSRDKRILALERQVANLKQRLNAA